MILPEEAAIACRCENGKRDRSIRTNYLCDMPDVIAICKTSTDDIIRPYLT